MIKIHDFSYLIGAKYNNLLVVEHLGVINKFRYVKCVCDCGKETVVRLGNIKNGHTKTCGCLAKVKNPIRNGFYFKHGDCNKRLYAIWSGIKARTSNKNRAAYPIYGGRGIGICDEWLDYTVFRDWAINSGYSDLLTIDRIDNNKGYCPTNCRWVTVYEQVKNRRNTLLIYYNGEKKSLKEWADLYGFSYRCLYDRLRRGVSVNNIFLPQKKFTRMRDQISVGRVAKLHPKVSKEVSDIITSIESSFPDFVKIRVVQGLRTFPEQQELYNQGRNGDKRPKVTNAPPGKSTHNFGLAIDFAIMYDKNKDGIFEELSWSLKEDRDLDGVIDWMEVVNAFKTKGWTWGGDWKSFKDNPHLEKTFGYSVSELLNKHKNKDFIPNTEYVLI